MHFLRTELQVFRNNTVFINEVFEQKPVEWQCGTWRSHLSAVYRPSLQNPGPKGSTIRIVGFSFGNHIGCGYSTVEAKNELIVELIRWNTSLRDFFHAHCFCRIFFRGQVPYTFFCWGGGILLSPQFLTLTLATVWLPGKGFKQVYFNYLSLLHYCQNYTLEET